MKLLDRRFYVGQTLTGVYLVQRLFLDVFQVLVELIEVVGNLVLDRLLYLVRLKPVDLGQIFRKQLVPCVNFLLGLPRLVR